MLYISVMEKKHLPPEVINYGDQRYEEGYARGYMRKTLDVRKRQSTKEKAVLYRFGIWYDFLDDEIARHKR